MYYCYRSNDTKTRAHDSSIHGWTLQKKSSSYAFSRVETGRSSHYSSWPSQLLWLTTSQVPAAWLNWAEPRVNMRFVKAIAFKHFKPRHLFRCVRLLLRTSKTSGKSFLLSNRSEIAISHPGHLPELSQAPLKRSWLSPKPTR
jgi:hypothetical protein